MVASGAVRLRRLGLGLTLGCGTTLLVAGLLGPGVALLVAVVFILASVFVADDGAGTFFPLAVLFVMAIAIVVTGLLGAVFYLYH